MLLGFFSRRTDLGIFCGGIGIQFRICLTLTSFQSGIQPKCNPFKTHCSSVKLFFFVDFVKNSKHYFLDFYSFWFCFLLKESLSDDCAFFRPLESMQEFPAISSSLWYKSTFLHLDSHRMLTSELHFWDNLCFAWFIGFAVFWAAPKTFCSLKSFCSYLSTHLSCYSCQAN